MFDRANSQSVKTFQPPTASFLLITAYSNCDPAVRIAYCCNFVSPQITPKWPSGSGFLTKKGLLVTAVTSMPEIFLSRLGAYLGERRAMATFWSEIQKKFTTKRILTIFWAVREIMALVETLEF